MSQQIVLEANHNRADLVKRGRWLEYFTITYNSLEGIIAIGAGIVSGSVAFADSIKGDEREFSAVENAEGLLQQNEEDVRTSI